MRINAKVLCKDRERRTHAARTADNTIEGSSRIQSFRTTQHDTDENVDGPNVRPRKNRACSAVLRRVTSTDGVQKKRNIDRRVWRENILARRSPLAGRRPSVSVDSPNVADAAKRWSVQWYTVHRHYRALVPRPVPTRFGGGGSRDSVHRGAADVPQPSLLFRPPPSHSA